MKIRRIAGFAAHFLMATCLVRAQATRTWVSGVGDDANPCSRIAPCKTFAGAISKTAPAGEINVLDPGGFGALTITKAITIDGGGNIAGVLVSGTNGIVVSAGASDVVNLRNLDFNGVGSCTWNVCSFTVSSSMEWTTNPSAAPCSYLIPSFAITPWMGFL